MPVSIFSDLFLFQSFLKIFSVFKRISIPYLQTIRFTINDVLSPPVRNNFYAVKAVFQLPVFYTYVHARESLNPFHRITIGNN